MRGVCCWGGQGTEILGCQMDNGAWEGEKAMSPKVNWVRGRTLEGGEKLDVPQST